MLNQPVNYDAEFCGRVPLNQTNLIQPHGVLVVTDPSFRIVQVSDNAEKVFGKPFKELTGNNIKDFINENQFARISERLRERTQGKIPFILSFQTGNHVSVISAHEGYLIFEIEIAPRESSGDDSFISVYEEFKSAMASVESAVSVKETCEVAIRELKRISGFDKIMIYKFDEQWNGDVIAEVKEPDMDAYLGLKFPASDVPKQARDLYKKNPYRLIPDADYKPIPLYPVINPITNAFTDLSTTNLRSVAAVHVEYLKNMRIMASMSTRILVDGELWGLISCHQKVPKYLSFEFCTLFELLSNIISAKISAVGKEDVFSYQAGLQKIYNELIEHIYQSDHLENDFGGHAEELMKLLTCEGMVVVNDGRIEKFGSTPDDENIFDLVLWLQSKKIKSVYHVHNLSSVYESGENFSGQASGLLALPIVPERGYFILAFRPEFIRNVNWGGNPNEAIRFEDDGKKYHPRNSFMLWQETVKGTAVDWTPEELSIAEQFRGFLVEYTLGKLSHH